MTYVYVRLHVEETILIWANAYVENLLSRIYTPNRVDWFKSLKTKVLHHVPGVKLQCLASLTRNLEFENFSIFLQNVRITINENSNFDHIWVRDGLKSFISPIAILNHNISNRLDPSPPKSDEKFKILKPDRVKGSSGIFSDFRKSYKIRVLFFEIPKLRKNPWKIEWEEIKTLFHNKYYYILEHRISESHRILNQKISLIYQKTVLAKFR